MGKDSLKEGAERAWIEINLNNLGYNIAAIKNIINSDCDIMAVVKANAYGHGAYEVAGYLNKTGIKAFAVATADEGIELRRYGICGEILILGYTDIRRAAELKEYDLTQTIVDFDYADALDRQGIMVKTHIKIDTGMHRLGIDFNDIYKVRAVFGMENIRVRGIFTHLCCADKMTSESILYTRKQIAAFYHLVENLKSEGIDIPKIHIKSSYGMLNYPDVICDYVRVGICMYGVLSSYDDVTALRPDLQFDLHPVLSLKSRVVLLRRIKAGEHAGYGMEYTADRDGVIAILPIGYADGYPGVLSCGRGYVLINGREAPVVGKICMDQLAVDVTDIPDVTTGTTATLIGRDGDREITAEELAKRAGCSTNELLSRMGKRVRRIYKEI